MLAPTALQQPSGAQPYTNGSHSAGSSVPSGSSTPKITLHFPKPTILQPETSSEDMTPVSDDGDAEGEDAEGEYDDVDATPIVSQNQIVN